MATTRIIHGVNELSADLSGRNVAQVRGMLAQALNIPADAVPHVGGERVGEDYVLAPGDELEFVKSAGVKGA